MTEVGWVGAGPDSLLGHEGTPARHHQPSQGRSPGLKATRACWGTPAREAFRAPRPLPGSVLRRPAWRGWGGGAGPAVTAGRGRAHHAAAFFVEVQVCWTVLSMRLGLK